MEVLTSKCAKVRVEYAAALAGFSTRRFIAQERKSEFVFASLTFSLVCNLALPLCQSSQCLLCSVSLTQICFDYLLFSYTRTLQRSCLIILSWNCYLIIYCPGSWLSFVVNRFYTALQNLFKYLVNFGSNFVQWNPNIPCSCFPSSFVFFIRF